MVLADLSKSRVLLVDFDNLFCVVFLTPLRGRPFDIQGGGLVLRLNYLFFSGLRQINLFFSVLRQELRNNFFSALGAIIDFLFPVGNFVLSLIWTIKDMEIYVV